MPARILHVDLDAFFVEVCRQHHPELRVGRAPGGGWAAGPARCGPVGVLRCQTLRHPRRNADRGGGPAVSPGHLLSGRFRAVPHGLPFGAPGSGGVLPHGRLASLDEAYLDFAGTERLYPISLLPIAEQLRDRVKQETGLDCSVGIGPNRMIAKLASDYAKPRGLMEVRAGWEEGFLAGLPLRAMPGVGPKTAERWAELGLVDVHQVQMMEERALERLIGPDARALKLRAQGQGGTVLRPDRLPKSVSRETTLSHDMRDPEKLERILALLTARVAGQLRDEQILARTVTMKLRHDDFRTVTRRQTLETATDLDAELYRAARDLFRAAFEEVRRRDRGVRLIGIAATNLGTAAEPDLFEPPERGRLRQLTAAVDKVRGKFGFNSVTAATILELRQRRGKRCSQGARKIPRVEAKAEGSFRCYDASVPDP